MTRAPVLFAALTAACSASTDPDTPDADPRLSDPALACLGSVELCDRPLDEIVLAATHNAMSNADEDWSLPNQQHPPRQQLDDGIRAMMLDTYMWRDEPYLCHTHCELGATPLVDVLEEIGAFLRANPGEILFTIFQNAINADTLDEALRHAGIADLRYTHPPGAPWPSPRALGLAGTPLLITVETAGPDDPPWHHAFYDLAFDTPYSFAAEAEFSCEVLRGRPAHDLFLINHWLSTPFPTREGSAQVNAREVLLRRVSDCLETHDRLPNIIAVDHYDLGDLMSVVEALNAEGPEALAAPDAPQR